MCLPRFVCFVCLAFSWCALLPRVVWAQADTVLLARFGDAPGQALASHEYTNPQGVRVHQYKLLLNRTQAETLGLLLHIGAEDSLDVKVMAVVGMHTLNTRYQRISSKDLLLIGADATTALDCGSSQPCKPNRVIVDMRLTQRPKAQRWVCQVILDEE